jgi:DNA-binding response OmpR family regulator
MVKKILIIEDDPTALRLTEYTLSQRGYQVLTTCNGLEGIITAQKELPDLVILDIMLPGIDGFEVCKRLRRGVQTAPIPILIISGKAQEEDIVIGLKAGANDYLPKPATPSTIINRVERLLAQKLSGQSKIVAFISSSNDLGMTTILSDVAAAIASLNKQVTLVDVAPGQRNGKNRVEASSPRTGRVILETDTSNNEKTPSVCEVLPSGIRVLHIDGDSESKDSVATGNIELLLKLSDVADYLLVDLPFKPTPFARSILSSCDLIIVASSCKLDNIYETKNVVKVLLFLGITAEKMAAVLVDPEGILPSASLAGIKPYLEVNLGIEMAGVVSFDAKVHQLSYLESQSIIQSSPGSQLAQDIKQIAQYIVSHSNQKQELVRSRARVPHLEKG